MYQPGTEPPARTTLPPRRSQRRDGLYHVMVGCGLAGVLLGGFAAVVDFSTGKHPHLRLPGLVGPPAAPGGTGQPHLPSLPGLPPGFPSLPSVPSGFPSPPSGPGLPSLPNLPTGLPSLPEPTS
jgi:hypothetical protein